jgi:hypothetical protein
MAKIILYDLGTGLCLFAMLGLCWVITKISERRR